MINRVSVYRRAASRRAPIDVDIDVDFFSLGVRPGKREIK